jgi:molybdate transport system substrate-binding protein
MKGIPMRIKRFLFIVGLPVILMAVAFAACGDDDDEQESTATSAESQDASLATGSITVFGASSLTEAFEEMSRAFREANPDVDVSFNFAGSQGLRTQLEQGASADVFASANMSQMDDAVESGVVQPDGPVFARNRLVVIVPKANEAGIETLQDLANPGVKVVLANPDVPVGDYSRQFLEQASADPAFGEDYGSKVLANVVSEESNVRQVASKVQLGEADAGIVYTSDVGGDLAEDVIAIEIPDELNEIATYPIAVTTEAGNEETAQAFIDFVLSEEGQAILESHGFLPAE